MRMTPSVCLASCVGMATWRLEMVPLWHLYSIARRFCSMRAGSHVWRRLDAAAEPDFQADRRLRRRRQRRPRRGRERVGRGLHPPRQPRRRELPQRRQVRLAEGRWEG